MKVSLEELIQLRWQARSLSFSSRKKAMAIMGGSHHSGFRGHGMDFLETRRYLPGDDVRAIDWRVTARLKKTHTKVFTEERERPILILVDYSSSMFFGTRKTFKSVIAAKAAALLAWAAVEQGDRVGGLVFSSDKSYQLRPQGGRHGVLRLLNALIQPISVSNDDKSNLTNALVQLQRVTHPGSLIFIISDFQSMNKQAEKHLTKLARHNHIMGLFIYDQMEKTLPPPGTYDITNGEQYGIINSNSKQLQENYQQQFEQRHSDLKTFFQQRQLQFVSLATDQELVETIKVILA
jgi:uncharacterized protein (DUF58 family)